MSTSKHTFLFAPGFPQLLDACLDHEIKRVSHILAEHANEADVCRSESCPVVGLHNSDECAELIRQAEAEGAL